MSVEESASAPLFPATGAHHPTSQLPQLQAACVASEGVVRHCAARDGRLDDSGFCLSLWQCGAGGCHFFMISGAGVDSIDSHEDISRSSDRPVVFGDTSTGRHRMGVYEAINADTVYPVTAYGVPL